ncbi:MAG: sigma-70 family RNA polymerase sigma factor [Oscillospiraceae bacterium]
MFDYIIREVFCGAAQRDELINELFLFLSRDNWRRVRQFRAESRFTTWLSVVAVRFFLAKRNELIDSDRNNSINERGINNIPCRCEYDDFVAKIDLYNLIGRLPNPRDRYVLLVLEIYGHSIEAVAAELGVTVDNLYNIRRRAKERLSNIVKSEKYVN